MQADLKKSLKAVTLELRHLLEGRYDQGGQWKPGDLEQRLAAIGVRRDRGSVPVDELGHLAEEDRQARKVVDAYLKLRDEAGVERSEAVGEFVRETAYTWANRLLALRCMEARELIDSVILQQEAYAGRSLEHHRLAQRHPELCAGDDDGLFAVLDKVFRAQAGRLPMLFDPQAPGIALRPSAAAVKDCFGMLSLNRDTLRKHRIRLSEDEAANPSATLPNPFTAPDALGWAYQYWNTEEKDRVFEKVRTVTGAKIAGADIVPATQLYTEDYMVKFLVQNSLGAIWTGMHPESKLAENWEYYVKDADRAPVGKKPVREITFLDPACGSGHFHLEAFDLFYAMYQEEGELTAPEEICSAILTKNLFGIDIDPRAVQIAEAALWMKAAERAFDYKGVPTNLVAAMASHLKGEAWEEFLAGFEREPSVARVLRSFARTMEHIDEIGSLARPAEDLREIIKEEHATWERQVSEKKEANFLFAEMNEDATSGQLPFHEISDEEFGDRLFYRAKAGIDAFTERARASGEFEDQMLGSETRAGFRLVELLSRRYDVVAANPPYMGSGNMGEALKRYVFRYYSTAKRDLYAAFILRALQLARSDGRAALVTQQSWMFLKSYAQLRTAEPESQAPSRGILDEHTVELIAHLGAGSFADIGGAVVNCALSVFATQKPTPQSLLTVFRLVAFTSSGEKAAALKNSLPGNYKFNVSQLALRSIPSAPVVYWAGSELLTKLATGPFISSVVDARPGIQTSDNARFLRLYWEAKNPGSSRRWYGFSRGGGYKKWHGLQFEVADWEHDGARMKHFNERTGDHWSRNLRNTAYLFRPGLTYSQMGGGSVGCRLLSPFPLFDVRSIAVFPRDGQSQEVILALLNSRYVSYVGRLLTQSLDLPAGYLGRIPSVQPNADEVTPLVRFALSEKEKLVGTQLQEYRFDFRSILNVRSGSSWLLKQLQHETVLLTIESAIERRVLYSTGLEKNTVERVLLETGSPTGWYPMIANFTEVPGYAEIPSDLRSVLVDEVAQSKSQTLKDEELVDLWSSLRSRFEAGPGSSRDDPSDSLREPENDENEEEDELSSGVLIPTEYFIEELSRQLQVSPLSLYCKLTHAVQEEGWQCLTEERRLWTDRVTVTVLRQLGHRWPKQIEAGEPVPDWADLDAIVPLTALAHETPLLDRVQNRLRADNIDTHDFDEVIGKRLDAWLATEFFKHHTKQFKKRPIAWQLQSGKFTARASPAFACLLYYHKLDTDTLPKLRSQYVAPLRQRLETELRGILAIVAEARSDRQLKRRGELDDAIEELQKVDTVLETVTRTGFGPQILYSTLRQNAIDDAMLALKVRWLRRLTELIAKSPLPDWLVAADRTELHPDFRVWIADAMAHLDHYCARVGPKAPDQSKLTSDPVAIDLAKLITPHGEEMLKDTLELACDKWHAQFDDVVLGPDKEKIKTLREEQKTCEVQLKAEQAPSAVEVRDLKYRVKEIKEDVKILTAKIKRRTTLANTVRAKIEGWQSKEPAGWGDWLAGQPLFDRTSSLDARRVAPTTIAEFITQESLYAPDINDGVRVNIAPLQKAGVLAADVLAGKDLDKAIADRAEWRTDERRWVREGKLPQPGWWPENGKK